jgi:O-antigen/teichoic acid export membrane protein
MMPSVFTGALAMVSTPALAARRRDAGELRSIAYRLLAAALGISLASTLVIVLGSHIIALRLYHQPDLFPLLRALSPLVALMGVQQVSNSMLAGLCQQRKALSASMLGATLNLALTWIWAGSPDLRLIGCAYAMIAGQTVTMLLNLSHLFAALRGETGR